MTGWRLAAAVVVCMLTSLADSPVQARAASAVAVSGIDLQAFPEVTFKASVVSGKPESALTAANFEVTQSGVPVQGLTVTEERNGSVDVVLAIDLSGSQVPFIEESKRAAIDIVSGLAPDDRVEVFVFDNQTEPLVRFTNDRAILSDAINSLGAKPATDTALHSAILTTVQAADAGSAPGRAVVILSDGEEHGGRSPAVESQIAELAIRRGIQVSTVYIGTEAPSPVFTEISGNTGGVRLTAGTAAEIGEHITNNLRSQYTVSFTSSTSTKIDLSQVQVRVQAREPSEASVSLCDGQSSPIAWIPGITDGQKVSGETLLEPHILCGGELSIQSARFILNGGQLASDSTPPFSYMLLTDKLDRQSHKLAVQLTLTDGSEIVSSPINLRLSGSPFNPSYLLMILGLAAAMTAFAFAMVQRSKRISMVAGSSAAANGTVIPPVPVVASGTLAERHDSSSGPVATGMLRVISGPTEGQEYSMGGSLILGRSPTADVLLSGSSISREHARIWLEGGVYRIRDLGSTNGTLVNGKSISEAVLSPGDRIEIRPFVIEVGGL